MDIRFADATAGTVMRDAPSAKRFFAMSSLRGIYHDELVAQ